MSEATITAVASAITAVSIAASAIFARRVKAGARDMVDQADGYEMRIAHGDETVAGPTTIEAAYLVAKFGMARPWEGGWFTFFSLKDQLPDPNDPPATEIHIRRKPESE